MTKTMGHVEELRQVASLDQCAWDYAQKLMRSSADEIERLDADAAGVQAELASVKLENERLQGLVDGAYNRGFAVGSGNEGHYQREIARLRAALQRIVSDGDYTAPEGMKRIARAAIEGASPEPGAVADEAQQRRNLLLRQQHAEKSNPAPQTSGGYACMNCAGAGCSDCTPALRSNPPRLPCIYREGCKNYDHCLAAGHCHPLWRRSLKLYIAHCIDRHIDPVIRVFDTSDAAISFAKKFAQEESRHPESIEEEPVQGWLYHANYSGEGDHVYVTETTLNDAS